MRTDCPPKRPGGVLLLVLLALPSATGCGGRDKGTVSGKVTYQGKPLSTGFVTFVLDNGAPLHSPIQSDGSYRMENVPLGPVKIGIQPKSGLDKTQPSAMPRNPKDFAKVKEASADGGPPIPRKYTDPNQSGLTYTVEKGSQQHDIDLK